IAEGCERSSHSLQSRHRRFRRRRAKSIVLSYQRIFSKVSDSFQQALRTSDVNWSTLRVSLSHCTRGRIVMQAESHLPVDRSVHRQAMGHPTLPARRPLNEGASMHAVKTFLAAMLAVAFAAPAPAD